MPVGPVWFGNQNSGLDLALWDPSMTPICSDLGPDDGAPCYRDSVGAEVDSDSRFCPDVVADGCGPPRSVGEKVKMLEHHFPHVLGLARA